MSEAKSRSLGEGPSHSNASGPDTRGSNADGSPVERESGGRSRAQSSSSHRALAVVFFALLIDLLGFTMILPLMPSLLEYYSHHDKSGLYALVIDKVDSFRVFIGAPDHARFNLVLLGGMLGSLFSIPQFIAAPLIGASSDIVGRKTMLLVSMTGVALSYALWAASNSFTLFVVARIVGGVSKGNVSLSTAIVADVTTPEKRSKGMALVGVAFSLGFIFGPIIGAVFSMLGREVLADSFRMYQYPACFALSLAIIDIIFIAKMFQETLPPEKRATSFGHGVSGALHLVNPVSLFRYDAVSKTASKELRSLRLMSAAYFIYLFLFSGLEYSLTFLVHQRFQFTSMQQGKMFLFIGVIMALVQGGYLRRRPVGSEKKTALTGIAVIIPGMLLVGFSSSMYMLYSGLFLYSFGAGTVVPSMTAMVSRFGEGNEKGKVMGIFRSIGALSRAIGPLVACAVYWSYSACVCYMLGAALLVVPLLVLSGAQPKSIPQKED